MFVWDKIIERLQLRIPYFVSTLSKVWSTKNTFIPWDTKMAQGLLIFAIETLLSYYSIQNQILHALSPKFTGYIKNWWVVYSGKVYLWCSLPQRGRQIGIGKRMPPFPSIQLPFSVWLSPTRLRSWSPNNWVPGIPKCSEITLKLFPVTTLMISSIYGMEKACVKPR